MWKPALLLLIAAEAASPPKMALDLKRPFIEQEWALGAMHVQQAWQTTRGRPDVRVAVLDGGVDDGHPDLKGQVIQGPNFTDFAGGGLDITPSGHGTHIAGVIAAMASAIRYAAGPGAARVINFSGGLPADPGVLAAMHEAIAAGVLVCLSAGNAGNPTYAQATPQADMACTLVVHGLDHQAGLATFSNYGDARGISAPALDILSTMPLTPDPFTDEGRSRYGRYGIHHGTSSATPLVAGVAALVFSALADARHVAPTAIDGHEVAAILRRTAHHLGDPGPNPRYGVGEVDAAAAVAACRVSP